MARTATGRIAGPDSPPVFPPNFGRIVSTSITIPSKVLIKAKPSAPAEITSLAIATISVTSGDNLTMIGNSPPKTRRTTSTTERDAIGSQAKTWPRFSTLGQEILTSSAESPETPRSRRANEP